MADALPQPKVSKIGQHIHLSYGAPHRINSAVWYPRQSPNGSAIVIYGHENGVRIIWRGGRRLKSSAAAGKQSKTNGSKEASIMIIDSDNEAPEARSPPFVDKPEFEDDEEENDSGKPYPGIVQHLDLNFGAAALHITVPPISASATVSAIPFGFGSAILNDQMIFAVACSDHRVRLITLPLTPPSPTSKARQDPQSSWTEGNAGSGKWGEIVLELTGSLLSSDGTSMTISRAKAEDPSVPGADDGEALERIGSDHRNRRSEWQILLASHYGEGPGLLLIHVVPIISVREEGKTLYSLSRAYLAPQQKAFMSSPATQISFNPQILSSSQSNHLLIADRSGACRIYDCGSFNTSAVRSSDNTSPSSQTPSVSWLLTLYPGFPSSKLDTTNAPLGDSAGNFGRKSVVDAKWVVGGKAILVLLADGEWGIWDIEGTGAAGSSKAILGRQGIRGGALTAFSISGWIDSSAPMKSTSTRGSLSQPSSSKFAPMTPGARKTSESGLFNGRSGLGFTRGQISVSRLPTPSATSLVEESVVFWLEESFYIIPNLRAYWEAQSHRSGGGGSGALFTTGSSTGRLIKLGEVNLLGQRCCGVAQHPREASAKAFLPTEILIIGEYHYVIISDTKQETKGPRRRIISESDYQVMAPRDLDVMEIDQMLDQMENRNSPLPQKRKSGFLS